MRIIRAYHYSTDCFFFKFNYSIALISPGNNLDGAGLRRYIALRRYMALYSNTLDGAGLRRYIAYAGYLREHNILFYLMFQ